MSVIACPVCGEAKEPAAHVTTIAVCASCGTSLAIAADGSVRRATAHDTDVLSASQLRQLQHARGQITRAKA
jgi:hypothetical protein